MDIGSGWQHGQKGTLRPVKWLRIVLEDLQNFIVGDGLQLRSHHLAGFNKGSLIPCLIHGVTHGISHKC